MLNNNPFSNDTSVSRIKDKLTMFILKLTHKAPKHEKDGKGFFTPWNTWRDESCNACSEYNNKTKSGYEHCRQCVVNYKANQE